MSCAAVRGERGGYALVLVLLAAALLAALVSVFVYEAALDNRVSRNVVDAVRAEHALDANEALIAFLLRRDWEESVAARKHMDGPGDAWYDGLDPWLARLNREVKPVVLEVRVRDVSARFDLNRVGRAEGRPRKYGDDLITRQKEAAGEFARLCKAFGYADGETAAEILRDWVDADEEGDHEEGAPHRPLVSVYELAGVGRLADDAAWRRLTADPAFLACVTVHSGVGQDEGLVNVNTAPVEVLEAITESRETAEAIVQGRPYEENVYNSPLNEAMGTEAYNRYYHRLAVESRGVRVEAVARVGPLRIERTTVIARQDGGTEVRLRLPGSGVREESES